MTGNDGIMNKFFKCRKNIGGIFAVLRQKFVGDMMDFLRVADAFCRFEIFIERSNLLAAVNAHSGKLNDVVGENIRACAFDIENDDVFGRVGVN